MQSAPQPSKHGVVAVLEDAAGRLLFIQRGLTIARAPGYWCFVGGEVEAGESYEAAVVREMSEEVGLQIEAVAKIHETISPNGEYRLHWMRVKLIGPLELTLHPTEVNAARWLSKEEAQALDPLLPTLKAWLQANATSSRPGQA